VGKSSYIAVSGGAQPYSFVGFGFKVFPRCSAAFVFVVSLRCFLVFLLKSSPHRSKYRCFDASLMVNHFEEVWSVVFLFFLVSGEFYLPT
jgi:hypothetical protein